MFPLSQQEFEQVNGSRVSMDSRPPISFFIRSFDFPLNLEQVLNPSDNVQIAPMFFTKCQFNAPVRLGNWKCTGNIRFEGCTFQDEVYIQSLVPSRIGKGCLFMHNLEIGTEETDEISDLQVEGKFRIRGSGKGGKITIKNLDADNQENQLALELVCQEVTLSNIHCGKLSLLTAEHIKQRIQVSGIQAKKVYTEYRHAHSEVELTESVIEQIRVHHPHGSMGSFRLSYCTGIQKLALPLEYLRKAEIMHCKINRLDCKGLVQKEAVVEIQHTEIQEAMLLTGVINEGHFSFRELTMANGGRCSIKSSNLGKADFIRCNFSRAILEFENSKITEIFLAETVFPRRVLSNGKPDPAQAQLAFGQLAVACARQGDNVLALEYQSREIEAHYQCIPWFRRRLFFFNLTKFNLGLNKISNDYGRNWGVGIAFTCLVGGLFFLCLVFSAKNFHFALHGSGQGQFFASYLKFMNPLRFLDTESLFKLNKATPFLELSNGSYFWDYLGRIFVAYGFYQTIQAFRRLGRK